MEAEDMATLANIGRLVLGGVAIMLILIVVSNIF
jgi:hypothetical protein